MKALVLNFFLIAPFICSSQNIVTFEFSALAGNESSATSNFNDPNFTSSTITRGSGVTAAANAQRFNSIDWTTSSSRDVNDYVSFNITPTPTISTFTVTGFTILHQRSGTGPRDFAFRTSADGFASDVSTQSIADVTTTQTWTATGLTITSSVALEIRVYGYSAEGAPGSWGPGDGTGNDIIITGSFVLPVSLTSFFTEKIHESVQISWQTASELNNSHFSIEKSTNGTTFREIGTVQGHGTSYDPNDYTFTDESPARGLNYYRLKQVDFDGNFEYSKVVSVNFDGGKRQVQLFPTLASSEIQVRFPAPTEEAGTIQVFDQSGKLVKRVSFDAELTDLPISVEEFQSGVYFVKVQNGQLFETLRFVKQ